MADNDPLGIGAAVAEPKSQGPAKDAPLVPSESDPLGIGSTASTDKRPDSYRRAAQENPDHVAEADSIHRRTGLNPNYVLANIDEAKKAAAMPNFEVMDSTHPITSEFYKDALNMGKAWDDHKALTDLEGHAQDQKEVDGILQALTAGWQGQASVELTRGKLPDYVLGPNSSTWEAAAATMGGLPEMMGGGFVGGLLGGPGGAILGGFTIPETAKAGIEDSLRRGPMTSRDDLLRRAKAMTIAGAKGTTMGLALEVVGAGAALYGASKATAKLFEGATLTAVGSAMEGRLPDMKDATTNFLTLLGAQAAGITYDRLGEAAKASKLRARDKQAFEAHTDNLIPARPVHVEDFDSHFKDEAEDQAKLLGIEDSYRAAKATNGDVEIPAGKYLSQDMDAHRDALEDMRLKRVQDAIKESEKQAAAEGVKGPQMTAPPAGAFDTPLTGKEGAGKLSVDERSGRAGDGREAGQSALRTPLLDLPKSSPGADEGLRATAEEYAREAGIPHRRQVDYAPLDTERGKRLADEFEALKHEPNNPEVKSAYSALIKETSAQFKSIKKLGIKIEAIKPGQENPYAAGSAAMIADVRDNKHLWFFPTEQGFGSGEKTSDHPLLADSGMKLEDGTPLKHNDVFRIVHDIFGHAKEGFAFGARGEENAWQSHVRMYSEEAGRAMTTETRGQNSWVNFHEKAAANKEKPGSVYADQKAGLLPEWAASEGLSEDHPSEDASGQAEEKAMSKRYQETAEKHPKLFYEARLASRVAKEKQADLDDIGKKISSEIGGEWGGRVKSAESLTSKVIRKVEVEDKPGYNVLEAKDLAAGSIIGGDWGKAIEAVKKLQERHGFKVEVSIEKPLNRFGYRGIQGIIDLGDGISGEIQIQDPAFNRLRKKTHKIYDRWRDHGEKDIAEWAAAGDPRYKQYVRDTTESRKLYNDYWDKMPSETKRALSALEMGREIVAKPNLSEGGSTQDFPSKTFSTDSDIQSNLPSGRVEMSSQSEAEGLGASESTGTTSKESIAGKPGAGKYLLPESERARLEELTGQGPDLSGKRNYLVMGEAIPAPELGHALLKATPEVKQEFTERALPILKSLADNLGIKADISIGSGAFEKSVSPNILSGIHPDTKPELVSQFARAIQFAFRQKAVPWARAQEDGFAIGVHFKFNGLTPEREALFGDLLNKALTGQVGYTKLGDRIAVVNYGGLDEATFVEALDKLAVEHGPKLGLAESKGYRTGGDYGPEQDWSKDRLGEALLHQASGTGRSDLQDRLLNAQANFDALSKEYEDGQSHPALTPREERERATSENVEAAYRDVGMGGLPIQAADERTQRELDKMQEAARKEAEKILLKPQLEELKAGNKAIIEKERARASGEIGNQVANEPVFRAYSLFNPEGAERKISQAKIWEKANDYINGKLNEQDTLAFEAISEMSGFTSADEMAKKLLTTERDKAFQSEVKSRTDKHMEQFASLKDTDAMRAEALKAIHNEKSGELLAMQYQVMEGMGQNAEINAEQARQRREAAASRWEQAKQLARDTIGALPVETAGRFRKYYTAERDAAVRAQKLSDAGKHQEALQARQEQLNSHAFAAESLRVADQIEAAHQSIEKQVGLDRLLWKDQDHFYQAAEIMRRFGFDRTDYDPRSRRENLSEWISRMSAKVGEDSINIPDWLTEESIAKKWNKLTVGQLDDVRNSLTNIRHLANEEKQARAIGRGIDRDIFIDDLVGEANKNVRGGHTPGADPRADFHEKMWNLTEGWGNVSYAMETIMSKFDGWKLGGKWGQLIAEKSKAQDNEAARKAADAQWWKETNSLYTPKELIDLDAKKIYIPEIKDSLSKRAMMVAIANTGTESNARVLKEGRGWTDEQIEAIKSHMEKRDFDTMQALLDRHELNNKPALAAMARRRTGFEPQFIAAKPIQTPFGEYKGGYLPLIRDNRASARAMEASSLDEPPQTFKAATYQGFNKERSQFANYPVSLDINDQLRALNRVSHYLTMQDWVSDMNSLMNDDRIKSTIIDTSGRDRLNKINDWVKDIAGNSQRKPGSLDPAIRSLMDRSVIAQLGTKLSVTLATGTHGIFAVGGVDPENFGPVKVYGGLLNFMGQMVKDPLNHYSQAKRFMLDSSKYMTQHAGESEATIQEAADSMAGKNRFGAAVREFAFSAMHGLYNLTITPIWNDAYKTGLILKDANHEAAVEYANMIVRNSSPPGRTSDIPTIMHDSSVGKLFFLMHGFADRQYQMMVRAGGRFGVQMKGSAGAADVAKATAQFLGTYANVLVIPGMAMAGLKMIGSRDDEREHKIFQKHTIRSLSPLTTYPVISTMQDMAIDAALGVQGNTSLSPVGAMFDSYQHLVNETASQKSATEQKMEAAARLASFAVPYPQAVNDAAFNLADIIFNGMDPRLSDLVRRRPYRERGE